MGTPFHLWNRITRSFSSPARENPLLGLRRPIGLDRLFEWKPPPRLPLRPPSEVAGEAWKRIPLGFAGRFQVGLLILNSGPGIFWA